MGVSPPTPPKTLRALPSNTRQGSFVKASSLREDGFAAAFILAVLTPLEPICAGAFAPAGKKWIFWQKIPLVKGILCIPIYKRYLYLISICIRKRMKCVCYNGVEGRNSPRGVVGRCPTVLGALPQTPQGASCPLTLIGKRITCVCGHKAE